MIYGAVMAGDFVTQRTVLLAVVAQDGSEGAQVRAVHLLAGEALRPDKQNWWAFQLGVLVPGEFKVLAQTSFEGGFVANVLQTIAYLDPVLYSRGDRVAARLVPSGAPAPLIGLSIAPEYGILSTKRGV